MRFLTLLAATLVATLTASAQLPSYVPADGLMAWYPFDGNADDASGNAHHGMVSGAVLTTDRNGAADAAYSFAGNCADRIDMDLPDMANNTAFSISFWAKRDGSGCLNPRLWEFWNGGITTQCGWFNSWDYITFSGVPINTTLNDGEWIHFVLTEDGQDWRTYVNGQLTNTYAQAFVTNSPDFAIGRMNHSAWDSFNGDLDDFGVWNRTLTAQEVEAMFLSEPVNRIGGTLQTDGTDDYVSFSLPSGWGESSFTVHFSATIEDFGTTSEVDGEHYLFGHALTGQNGDIGFKAQTIPNAQQMRWAFSDDDGDGSLNIIANPVLEANTWYDFTLVFDRTTSQANVYINGAEAGSAAIPSNLGNLESGLPVGLGAFVYPPSSDFRHFHQGQFGDAYFFPAALTESQVEDLALTCSAPLVAGSAHWGVQEDEYVNLATLESVTRVGGVVSQSAAPCQTSCTNPNIAEPTCSILPEYVPSDDLVAFFALDGNADDLGPNDFQASTASNAFTADREGNAGLAGDFDGIDDFIEIPSDAILDTIVHELTLAAWVNYTGTNHGAVLVRRDFVGNPQGERHHFQLNVDSDRALSFSAYDNSDLANHNSQTTTPPGVIQAGQWHHIALTYNEGLCTFYVDGSSVFSEDFPGQTLSPNGHWINIGRVHRAGGNPYFDEFQGGIDEAGIWSRALTETELIALATSDANPSIAGCTDEAACNYDLEATADDGNCTYSPTIYVDGTYVSDTVFTQLNETLVFGSGSPAEADSTLLDEFSLYFNQFSSRTLPELQVGTDYRLIVTGRYGYADGWSHNDAAFNYAWDVETGTKVNCNGTQDAQASMIWRYDGVYDFQRPDNDTDNNAQFCSGVDKTYFWTIPGDGNSHTVGFIDNGGYGDNSGELSFKLYELSNASSITWPDGSSGPEWTYEANATGTFDLTLSDGSCSTNLVIVVDHTGCTDASACNYDADASEDNGSCTHPPSFDLGEDMTLCAGETATLTLDLPGQEMLWSTGSTETEIAVTESGTYSVEAGTTVSPEATAVEFGPNQLGIMGPAAPELDLAGTSEVTLATWVKLNSNSHQFRLVSTQSSGFIGQQYALMVSSGRLYFISGSSSFEANGLNLGNATLPTDTWIHAAVTVSADGVRFYLDGELDLFNPVNDVLPSGYSDIVVLARHANGSGGNGIPEQLDGSLSQVGIWNRALSAEEMAALPNCPPSTDSEGLIGLWLADQTPTTVVTDETGNGSNIDLTSGTVVSGPEQSCSSCTATDQVTVTFDPCYGCTDDAACNYDAAAATNDGSCEYTQEADYGLDPTLLACAPGVTLSAPAGLSGYTWSDGSTGPDLAVSESGTYTLSISEGESTGCGLAFEQGDYASLNQPISVDSDGYALRARVLFPLPETLCGSTPAHNLIMSSDNPVAWTPLGIRHNGQLAIHWNQNGFHWIESGYNTDALTGWHTVGVVLNGGMAEFYVDDEQVGSAAFTLPASATLQNLGNYIPTYWNSCQPIGQLDYVQLWLPDGNGQVDATPWNGVTPNHQWDLDCGNATAATQGTVDLTLQGSPEEITFNTACQSTDAVVVTINQNCVTTEFCGEGTIWDEDLGQCVPTVTDVPSAASCGAGTHWDPVTEMCIADVPGTTDENCTVMNLQELAEGYQVLLDHTADQDSIILALSAELDTCDGTIPAPVGNSVDGPCSGEDYVTYQGYDYGIIEIGNQCWLSENLNVTEFRDGTPIQHLQGTNEWLTTDAAGWCYPEDAQGNALAELGRLYNFWVVGNNICPSGWRIPSFAEWFEGDNLKPWFEAQASEYAGMTGAALKVPGTESWNAPNAWANNQLGFNGLPTGSRNLDGEFSEPGSVATYHINNTFGSGEAHHTVLSSGSTDLYRISPWRGDTPETWHMGTAIRCVKD